MSRSRAFRRFHLRRMKDRARRVLGRYGYVEPERFANHMKPCSCWACGNQRRASGRTMQERRADERDKDIFSSGF